MRAIKKSCSTTILLVACVYCLSSPSLGLISHFNCRQIVVVDKSKATRMQSSFLPFVIIHYEFSSEFVKVS